MEHLDNTEHKQDNINVKSVVLTGHGSFEYVKVIEWPLPKFCQKYEVKVAVEYCGVNFADVYHVHGRLLKKQVPYVLGLECAGKIIQLGDEAHGFKVGDRVVCYQPDGGLFRETVIVPTTNCFIIPHDICTKIACTLMANYLTAYFALFDLGNLRPGQTVLIHSAAGGVGWAATQLANRMVNNVRVLGTASDCKHLDICANGVTHPLSHEGYDTSIAKASIDVIIDNIGGENLIKSVDLLSPLGRVVLIGANCVVQEDDAKTEAALQSMGSAVVPTQQLMFGNKGVFGLHLGSLFGTRPDIVVSAAATILSLCQQGHIEPRVHTVLPFAKAEEAIKALADRKNIGKVLLKVE